MTILLVPGTAQTSLAIADLLAASSHPYVLGVRSTSRAKGLVAKSTNAAHPTIHLDLADRTTWSNIFASSEAFAPIDTIYLLPPPIPDFPPLLTDFINSTLKLCLDRTSKPLKRIVFLSSSMIPLGGPAHGQIHQLLDESMQPQESSSDPLLQDYAVLRPSWFAQNFITSGSLHDVTIREESTIYSATGDSGKIPFVDVADIAAVAAVALTEELVTSTPSADNPSKGNGTEYFVLGPELLTYADVAAILTKVLDKPIRWINLSVDELAGRLVEKIGINEGYAPVLAGLDSLIAKGDEERMWLDKNGGCVKNLLGRDALSVEKVLRRELGR